MWFSDKVDYEVSPSLVRFTYACGTAWVFVLWLVWWIYQCCLYDFGSNLTLSVEINTVDLNWSLYRLFPLLLWSQLIMWIVCPWLCEKLWQISSLVCEKIIIEVRQVDGIWHWFELAAVRIDLWIKGTFVQKLLIVIRMGWEFMLYFIPASYLIICFYKLIYFIQPKHITWTFNKMNYNLTVEIQVYLLFIIFTKFYF